jgi:hypothetical protein
VIIVIGRQPTVAAMRINAHITRFWRDPGDHAGDKASAHIGGSFAGQAVPLMASRTRDWPVADCRAWRLARKTDIITIDM